MGRSAGLSRRDFLTGAAAGAAAVAGAGLLGGCKAGAAEDNIKWDKEIDFVLVGSGCGLAGAVAAMSKGLKVIVCEAAATVGGNTILSGGGVWVPNTKWSQEAAGDTKEDSLTYMKHLAWDEASDELVNTFVDRGGEILQLLADQAKISWESSAVFGDYHPEYEGGLRAGRALGVKKENDEEPGAGYPLISRLQKAIKDGGGEILTGTPVTALITRTGANGVPEVLGVEATPTGESAIKIKAKRGVLLASGGYEWDDELTNNFLRGMTEVKVSVPTNKGDGLKMCMALGADLRLMNECFGMPCYVVDKEVNAKKQAASTLRYLMQKAKPGSITVNGNGARFVNECADYDTFWRSMIGWRSWGDNGYLNIPCWIVVDQLHVDRWGLNTLDQVKGTGPGEVDARAVKGNTIAELAAAMKVPADNLVATVARFNQYAALGQDPDFHRGESYYDKVFLSDMGQFFPFGDIRGTLGTLEKPPFYAMQVTTGTLGTCGGPRVNKNDQVLHVNGQVIGRLYCAGNASGVGGPGPSYGGAGGTLGPAVVFSGIAGLHAAGLTAWDAEA